MDSDLVGAAGDGGALEEGAVGFGEGFLEGPVRLGGAAGWGGGHAGAVDGVAGDGLLDSPGIGFGDTGD